MFRIFCVLVLTLQSRQINAYPVRLVGGSTSAEGRVEVYKDLQWQTVCDNGWTFAAANVVCRQLGYQYAIRAAGRALFGEGTGRQWETDLRCGGSENDLRDCFSTSTFCSHSEDAGVVCSGSSLQQYSLRLEGSSLWKYRGRVEIYVNREWGTVCNNRWGHQEAFIACRQMGFTGAVYSGSYSIFGLASGTIWLDNVNCAGSESRLIDCGHGGLGESNCSHVQDIGIQCTGYSGSSPTMYTIATPTFSAGVDPTSTVAATVGGVVGGLTFLCILFALPVVCICFVCCCAASKRSSGGSRSTSGGHFNIATSAGTSSATAATAGGGGGSSVPRVAFVTAPGTGTSGTASLSSQPVAVSRAQPNIYDPPPPAYPGTPQPTFIPQPCHINVYPQQVPPEYPPSQTSRHTPAQTSGNPPPYPPVFTDSSSAPYPPDEAPGYLTDPPPMYPPS